MSKSIAIPNHSWIVVADGVGARLFSAAVDGERVALTSLNELELNDPVERGTSGTRPPEQTEQQKDEATFACQLARTLYLRAHAGKFDDLVVIADPQTLGQLRGLFHKEVTDRIVAEVPKTLTNLSPSDLEDSISRMMAN